jgi:hypothetical protein
MRLILSRKGFDSSSGGCPSPIFPDRSIIALPIPDKKSPVRYRDLNWRGRNLGDVVAKLTRGRQRKNYRAHLDPDLRKDMLPREPGWRPALGQRGSAQGHLRKQGVGVGDLFLFWAVFRAVDQDLRWLGRREHHIWGWLQVGTVAPVDEVVRRGGEKWRWAGKHPHLAFQSDNTNTLYVASERLSLPGLKGTPGSGVFDFFDDRRRLTAEEATSPSKWSLPAGFLPKGRTPLSYHGSPSRWSQCGDRTHLSTVARGQEFVLDLEHYPELTSWIAEVVVGCCR